MAYALRIERRNETTLRREGQAPPPPGRQMNTDFFKRQLHRRDAEGAEKNLGEKTGEAAEAFFDALHRGGVGEAEMLGGAEGFAGNDHDVDFVEEALGDFGRGLDAAGAHPAAHVRV